MEGVMKPERRIPYFLFLVGLSAAMQLTASAGGFTNPDLGNTVKVSGGVSADVNAKVSLCHIPPGNPEKARTIVVGQAAVAAHLAHGDYLGECQAACSGVPSAVPKTGQTVCRDPTGYPVDCTGTGQDGEHQLGVSISPRFTDNADGTVKVNLTGLIWLKNANCFVGQAWPIALSQANTLESGSCGLTDGSVAGAWRLPNVKELESLIDFGSASPALPAGHPFSGVQINPPYDYWTSSSAGFSPSSAWAVSLYSGSVHNAPMFNPFYAWPVRGGQ
jgi:hypothetical protein